MRHGNNKLILLIFFIFANNSFSTAEDRITTSPLINLDKIKPSFEEIENSTNDNISNETIKNKKEILSTSKVPSAKFIGLDKITAKTSEIIINLGETKKFGPLEIKVLKCGRINSENSNNNIAYLQVKDLSENQNDKVFIFNGWTFSKDPSIAPFDHAIYDLQLVKCDNV